jgi:peptide/nickel transport system substrate-binding protein
MVTSFVPGEGITMVRNPNYFGGQVYLDGIKFIYPGDAGGTKTLDFFNAGTVQTAFLRTPQAVTAAVNQKTKGVHFPAQSGSGLLMNVGIPVNCSGGKPAPACTGKPDGPTPSNPPTKDLNLRKAIQAAIDPNVVNQRANNSQGLPGSQLLQSSFTWYPNVPGPKYDTTAAKQYVKAAQADGWDGKVRVLANNTPTGMATGLAVDALLKAVGINDDLNISVDAGQMTQQYVIQHDFDIVITGFATSNDEGGMVALLQNFSCKAPSNRIGFCDPTLDNGLTAVRAAPDDAGRVAGYKTVSQEVITQVPWVPMATIDQFMVWSPKVHGVMDTSRDSVMFDKAWVEH